MAALVAAVAVVAHWNTLDNGFVNWDDTDYISKNPLVVGDGGLTAIWTDVFQEKPHEQYYPLVFTSLWVEHKLFGLEPTGYHATQLVLHALNAAVLFFAFYWLGAPVSAAIFAAALFAVHPINVASVAWLAERKNTLSGLFFWMTLLLYLRHRRGESRWRYVAALVAFQFALFSKTAALVLAPVLVLTDRVLDGRWSLASIKRTLPFFALGFLMALVTAHVEGTQSRSGQPIDILLRPLVAAAAVAHYLQKIVLPLNLLPIYPRWPESFAEPRFWISAAILAAGAALAWRYREKLGPLVLWGMGLFLLAVFPMLGFMHFNFMQYAFVSDHFMYLSAPGVFLAIGVLLDRWAGGRTSGAPTEARKAADASQFRIEPRWAVTLVLICVACGWLTVRQNRVWKDPVSFWEHTLSDNKECFAGNYNLGNHFYRLGKFETALPRYREAARIDPTHINSEKSCARCCMRLGRTEEALQHFERAVERAKRKQPRGVKTRTEYADFLRNIGRLDDAMAEYQAVLKIMPTYEKALAGQRLARERLKGSGNARAGKTG